MRWMSKSTSFLRLDAAVGDGDHGVNVVTALRLRPQRVGRRRTTCLPADVLKVVAQRFPRRDGWRSRRSVREPVQGHGPQLRRQPTDTDTASSLRRLTGGVETVMRRGQTSPGDKTMVDALVPAAAAATEAAEGGRAVGDALAAVAAAARQWR